MDDDVSRCIRSVARNVVSVGLFLLVDCLELMGPCRRKRCLISCFCRSRGQVVHCIGAVSRYR